MGRKMYMIVHLHAPEIESSVRLYNIMVKQPKIQIIFTKVSIAVCVTDHLLVCMYILNSDSTPT